MYNLYELYIRERFVPASSAWDNDTSPLDGVVTANFLHEFERFIVVHP